MKAKFIFTITLSIFFLNFLTAQNPGINYQAVVRDAGGNLLTSQNVDFEFNFYDKTSALKCTYSVTKATNNYGVVNLTIDPPCLKTGIPWYQDGITMRVTVNGIVLPGAQQMNYVPYAILADSARNARIYSAGAGILINAAGVISLPPGVDTDQSNDLLKTDVFSGDVTGTYSNTQIAQNAITNDKMADNAVGSNEIINGSIANADLGANAVTTDKILDGTIQPADLNVSITGGLWTPGANGSAYRSTGNVGVGLTDPNAALHVASVDSIGLRVTTSAISFDTKAISARVIPNGDVADAVAVFGESAPGSNYGIGGQFRGGYKGVEAFGDNYGGDFNSTSTGVSASGGTFGVYGTSGNTGVYGYGATYGVRAAGGTYGIYASGSTAGYFSGNVTVTSGATISGGLTVNNGSTLNSTTNINGSTYISGFTQISQSGNVLYQFNNASGGGAYASFRGSTSTKENLIVASLSGNNNNGYLALRDAAGTGNRAGMYLNTSNQGVIFADVKNFRMAHPTQAGKEIWYACIEGPEAAAFERGTATLVNGEISVSFSDHFGLVVNPSTLTVILTPLSADSKGLAVVQKTETGFKVKELLGGTGNYSFDWEVKGVRKGYENYKVIRDKDEQEPSPAARQ